MKVKEIMKSPVITVNKNATIKECGDLLEKHGINGAPVVDDNRVVGLITKADIFKSILPRYPEIFKDERHLMDFEYMEERIRKVTKIEVSELMGSPAMTLDQETPIVKAGSIMVLRKIKQMPVMKDDKLVGIITLTDVFRNLMEKAGKG
ncbi:MAG: CBS domain-containing protein [Deltaproteobacteria bacterium]|nr:CBS domain-containing protein [Deltaproteobacteria bacterium]MBW1795470.1 CBS domain-containing protein [Deltaproteobacteria bacterium]MBW2330460.1 CBS domain-containing protein [Deltaproteobacteria bacterium]